LNFFDRFRGSVLVDRGYGENRLALEERLIGEPTFGFRIGRNQHAVIGYEGGGRRQIVRRENRFHTRHRERGAEIHTSDASMRQGTEQQLAEEHAVGAIILGIFGLAGYLRHQVGRGIILADQLMIWLIYLVGSHGYVLRMFSAPRIIAVRILS
jgi:hypothetical protein